MTSDGKLSDDQLAELERLAAAATAGPWSEDPCNELEATGIVDVEVSNGFQQVCDTVAENTWSAAQCRDNARFIAAANPMTVGALVAEVRRLREEVERLRFALDGARNLYGGGA